MTARVRWNYRSSESETGDDRVTENETQVSGTVRRTQVRDHVAARTHGEVFGGAALPTDAVQSRAQSIPLRGVCGEHEHETQTTSGQAIGVAANGVPIWPHADAFGVDLVRPPPNATLADSRRDGCFGFAAPGSGPASNDDYFFENSRWVLGSG